MSLFGNPFRDLGDGFYFQLSLYIGNGEAGLALPRAITSELRELAPN
jgi:hypothetical protein